MPQQQKGLVRGSIDFYESIVRLLQIIVHMRQNQAMAPRAGPDDEVLGTNVTWNLIVLVLHARLVRLAGYINCQCGGVI